MNKLLNKYLTIFLLAVAVFACKKEDDETPFLEIATDQLVQNFTQEAHTRYVLVSSNREFTVSGDETWCEATVRKDQSATAVYLSIAKNETVSERTAKVTVASEGLASLVITVNQLGSEASLSVKESGVSVEDKELEFTLEVTANLPIAFDLPEWIHANGDNTPAIGTKVYLFKADALPEGEQSRNNKIIVRAADPSVNKSVEVPVLQINNYQWLARDNWVITSNGSYGNAQEDNGHEAMLDGDKETKWAWYPPAAGGDFYITLDTRGDKLIERIKVTKHCNVKKLVIAISKDGDAWTEAGTLSYGNDCAYEWQELLPATALEARYIRFTIAEETWPGGYSSIREIEIYGRSVEDETPYTPEGEWLDRTGWIASTTQSRYAADNENWGEASMFDDDINTKWAGYAPTDGSPFYIMVDMQSDKIVKNIHITKHCNPEELLIELSQDAENWQTAGILEYDNSCAWQWAQLDLEQPITARFMKITITKVTWPTGYSSIRVIKVFGQEISAE